MDCWSRRFGNAFISAGPCHTHAPHSDGSRLARCRTRFAVWQSLQYRFPLLLLCCDGRRLGPASQAGDMLVPNAQSRYSRRAVALGAEGLWFPSGLSSCKIAMRWRACEGEEQVYRICLYTSIYIILVGEILIILHTGSSPMEVGGTRRRSEPIPYDYGHVHVEASLSRNLVMQRQKHARARDDGYCHGDAANNDKTSVRRSVGTSQGTLPAGIDRNGELLSNA